MRNTVLLRICRLLIRFAAGGQFSLAGGMWLDGVQSPECKPCPQSDPSVVICEGNSVTSQPGHYAYFIEEQSRRGSHTAVAVTACPNRAACKYLGQFNSVCESSLSVCNNGGNTSGKCAEGYHGDDTFAHANHAARLAVWDFQVYFVPNVLTIGSRRSWLVHLFYEC